AYVGLAERGQSIFDGDSKAILPHRADWTALLDWLNWHAQVSRERAKVTTLPVAGNASQR
ncbi:MAG: hypothetical protein WAS23_10105, partial [Dokdonella sp.]